MHRPGGEDYEVKLFVALLPAKSGKVEHWLQVQIACLTYAVLNFSHS